MKIYIAAPFPLKDRAIGIMQDLTAQGFEITSRWLTEETKMGESFEENKLFAIKDLEDVVRSHVLLLLNPPGWENSGTGGRHFETAFALSTGLKVIIYGVRSNVFYYLDGIDAFETFNQVLDELILRRQDMVTGEYV